MRLFIEKWKWILQSLITNSNKILNKHFFYIIIIVLLSAVSACRTQPAIPKLAETYSRKDKKPFGSYVMHAQVEQMFSGNTIKHQNEPFEDVLRYKTDNNSLYICVTKSLFLSDEDENLILDYVAAGNNIFIAASYIHPLLLDEIGCKLSLSNYNYITDIGKPLRNTHVNLEQPVTLQNKDYGYYYLPFSNSFYDITSPYIKVLANNEYGKPNAIVFFHGKGKLFLHCDPRAFSNYFLLKKDNYQYFKNLAGYITPNPDYVYWDDYYNKLDSKKGRGDTGKKNFSALNTIFKHPALKLAFWLILLLSLLYILFQSKRRQRIIETIKPNENTSVAFTETVGRLYLQNKDNHNIAQKMIAYFNEHIRNNYFLNTNHVNAEFIVALSRKSGVDKNKIESLYLSIQQAQGSTEIPDFVLLSLNEKIQNFFKIADRK